MAKAKPKRKLKEEEEDRGSLYKRVVELRAEVKSAQEEIVLLNEILVKKDKRIAELELLNSRTMWKRILDWFNEKGP